jgi:hypothetical protein
MKLLGKGGRSNDIQVEKFKRSFHSRDSLHAKYSSRTGQPVVADNEWGHLQIGECTLHPVLRFRVSGFFLKVHKHEIFLNFFLT